jgi:hypothetical protein
MGVLPIRIKHALDVPIEHPHDADPREHCRAAQAYPACALEMLSSGLILFFRQIRELRVEL